MSEQSVTDTIARPLVAALDAAIAAQQDVIRQLMRARAIAVQQYDDAAIDAALDLRAEDCPVCGPACICELREAMAARGEVTP